MKITAGSNITRMWKEPFYLDFRLTLKVTFVGQQY
jgi:hypothetical protein